MTTKRLYHRTDSTLLTAERYALCAAREASYSIPSAELAKAWRGHMFTSFHDILPGSSTEAGYLSARPIEASALQTAGEVIVGSEISRIRGEAKSEGLPLFVFNPHPYPLRMPVVADFMFF